MPYAFGWHSRGRESPALNRRLIGLVISLSVLSYRRASEVASLHAVVVVRH